MKKNIKTIEAVNAYNAMKGAKLTKMEDGEKFAAIAAMRQLKKTAGDYEDFAKDAAEKLRPENFDDLQERARKFATLADEEKLRVNRELQEYDGKVAKCVRPEGEKAVELDFEPLSRDAFSRLLASNDFDLETSLALQDILCE